MKVTEFVKTLEKGFKDKALARYSYWQLIVDGVIVRNSNGTVTIK
ncbi:hypothetical protein PBI_GRAYSON_144 [Rhodococcus phage Grayson]|nr:hypothetical protein PBI_GRAYSON_144 [Rhodococcus phage Grayson]